MQDVAKIASDTNSPDPRTGLRAVAALARLQYRLEAVQVRNARLKGWTWQDIADELGVTRQAVHKKYWKQGWGE